RPVAQRRPQRARGHRRHRRAHPQRLRHALLGDAPIGIREVTHMSRAQSDVIVIGAGPYGLAAAAHLSAAGANIRVFGSPMSFWTEQMPKGMLLRSPWGASHISDPKSALTLDAFERGNGTALSRPVPLGDFIAYGHWFQQRAVPEVDPRRVQRVEALGHGLRVILEDGESLDTRRVAVAAGLSPFASRPPEFPDLPRGLVTHSSEHADLAPLPGRRAEHDRPPDHFRGPYRRPRATRPRRRDVA